MFATKLKSSAAISVLLVVAFAGLGVWLYQIQQGLIVTNMRNPFSWGLYIAMWAFFVGTAAGGLVVTSAIYLFKVERLKPVGKVASLTAFIFTIAAMGMLLPDLGRPDRFHHLFLYPQFGSVLIWDFLVLSTYGLISAIYTYLQMRPGIASSGIRLPLLGTIGKREVSEEELARMRRRADQQAMIIAPVALVFAILIHTVTAWVLATQLSRSWWFGGTLAPTFISAAIASGPAVVILGSFYALKHTEKLEQACALLAKIAAFGTVVLLFIYYNDIVVRSWWGEGGEYEASKLVLTRYLPLHVVEILFMILAVILFVRFARSNVGLIVGSLSLIIGVVFHRFLLMPSAYNLVPFRVPTAGDAGYVEWPYPMAVGELRGVLDSPAPLFVSNWDYVPSPVEFTIVAGALSAVIIVFILLSRMLPTGAE